MIVPFKKSFEESFFASYQTMMLQFIVKLIIDILDPGQDFGGWRYNLHILFKFCHLCRLNKIIQ